MFDSRQIARYGYRRLKNVINALDFERISHASGPTSGEILTSEGQPPASVAIIHCVGSRDEHDHEYCSRVCCMDSLKFAHLVKEKTGAEVYNCYIDMRTPGKGYEEFYKRLLHEGVQFIRGKVAEVTDVAEIEEEEGKLVVVCEDTLLGLTRRLPVDMVILSAALQPGADADHVARLFSLSCSQGDFFLEKHPKLAPVEAATEGIYLAGACQGPKDIPDSVAQGAAAAACALSLADRGMYVLEPITSEIDPRAVQQVQDVHHQLPVVCPEAHHMAASKALDALFHVDPPPAAKKLRELFYKVVLKNSAYLRLILGDTYFHRTYNMGTVDADNCVNFYDGDIRVVGPDGKQHAKYPARDYGQYITERIEPWSYLKFPYLKKIGWKGLVDGVESGVYKTTPLSRLNAADGMTTPLAQVRQPRTASSDARPRASSPCSDRGRSSTPVTHWGRRPWHAIWPEWSRSSGVAAAVAAGCRVPG